MVILTRYTSLCTFGDAFASRCRRRKQNDAFHHQPSCSPREETAAATTQPRSSSSIPLSYPHYDQTAASPGTTTRRCMSNESGLKTTTHSRVSQDDICFQTSYRRCNYETWEGINFPRIAPDLLGACRPLRRPPGGGGISINQTMTKKEFRLTKGLVN